MIQAARGVLAALAAAGQTLGTAESLTGGLVCASLTDVAGSSAVVRGSVVAYAVPVKVAVLGVGEDLLREHGVVSRECAVAMANGARRVLGADWAVATTGVAGPGPADGHPAGTVHLAVVGPADDGREQLVGHRVLSLHGSRDEVRRETVVQALALLLQTLQAGCVGGGT